MAFTKLSAAGKYSVGPLNKALEDKGGIHPAGTHNPDGTEIRRILVSRNPGRVSGGVTAPITQKPKYFGIKLVSHAYSSIELPKASIWAIICSFVKPPMEIAKVGQ